MLFCMLGYEELVSIWVSTLFLISPTQIKQLFSNQLTNYITLTNAVITVYLLCPINVFSHYIRDPVSEMYMIGFVLIQK